MKTPSGIRPLLTLGTALLLLIPGCGKTPPQEPLGITVELADDQGQLLLVVHNCSGKELMFCRRNFYLPLDYIDIRHYPDTAALPFEKIFGKKPCVVKRKDVTVSDFVALPPNEAVRLPVDLRCVRNGCSLGDTVFIAVRFMNVDPFICSRLEIKKFKADIQHYCELFHYIPNKDANYWVGEVKTPYFAYSFCR
jgi:hypothetical protein